MFYAFFFLVIIGAAVAFYFTFPLHKEIGKKITSHVRQDKQKEYDVPKQKEDDKGEFK